jgi:type IV secretory pathway VirB10-like protein
MATATTKTRRPTASPTAKVRKIRSPKAEQPPIEEQPIPPMTDMDNAPPTEPTPAVAEAEPTAEETPEAVGVDPDTTEAHPDACPTCGRKFPKVRAEGPDARTLSLVKALKDGNPKSVLVLSADTAQSYNAVRRRLMENEGVVPEGQFQGRMDTAAIARG